MAQSAKQLEKCGFLALLMMLITGTLFGLIGVVAIHFLTTYFEAYYIILIFPIVMAILLGFGLSLGAKIGRCSRLNVVAAILVLIFSVGCYGLFLFLTDYYQNLDPKPATIVKEYFILQEDVQNFLGELPYVSTYVPPVENSARADTHIGITVVNFIKKFPELAQQKPVVIGNSILTRVQQYLVYAGITEWRQEEGSPGQLIFAEAAPVQTWTVWATEFLFVFVIALLFTRGGAKKAYRKRVERLEKSGVPVQKYTKSKPPKEKKPLFGKKKKKKRPSVADVELAPQLTEEEATAETKKPSGKKKKEKEKKEKKAKKGFSLFGGKKKVKEEVAEEAASPEAQFAEQFPEDQRYAMILHQFDSARQNDLLQLIQQVGQVPEDKARKLLKTPSLLKRDVTSEEARVAIEKFYQLNAQIKLITMEQLAEIQKRQQASTQSPPSPPPSQPASAPRSAQAQSSAAGEDRYALILKSFDQAQRKPILELLSSLSGRPVAQLQQTLKPPALILRDATKDEVTMIAQQFQTLQAEVKSLTMADLQKLMARNKQA